MKKNEIEEYIKSKSVTQDTYVAPTVQRHVDTRTPALSAVSQTVKPTTEKKGNILTTIGKTLLNIPTNMAIGALKTMEGVADTASDVFFNPIERNVNYAYDFVTKGKKTADENFKDLAKMQQRDIQKNRTEDFLNKTGYNDYVDEYEKDSLVKRGNIGGQVVQGIGGMVPSLVIGGAYGGTPSMQSTQGLSGAAKAKAIAGNVGRTYMAQAPANAVLGASSYGSGMEEALNNGATMDQARRYGLANAAIEQGTEMLTGGVPGLEGKGGLDQFVEPLLDKTGGYVNPLLKAGYRALGEGAEEYAGAWLEPLAKKIYSDEKIDWNQVRKNARQAGLVGTATGAILDSPQFVNELTETNQNIKEQNNKKVKQENTKKTETKENVKKLQEEITPTELQEAKVEENASSTKQDSQVQEKSNIEKLKETITPTELKEAKVETEQSKKKGIDYSQEKYKNFTDSDKEMMNNLYEKYKNKEAFTKEEQQQLDYLNRKQKSLKNPELKTNNTMEDLKSDYGKYYKNNNLDNFDSTMLDNAKEIVQANRQGRRTKQEWLDIAQNIGTQAENLDSEALKRYAFESFKAAAPNQTENLNRQGKKYVGFGIDEWVNKVYEGAGVGKKINKQDIKTSEDIKKAELQAIEDNKINDDSMTSLDKPDINTVKSAKGVGLKGPFSDLDVEIPGLERVTSDTKFDNDTNIQENNENVAETKQEPVIKVETTGKKGKQHFQELGANEKVAEILSEVPKNTKPNAKETITDTIRDVRRAFVSKGETIERLSRETKNPNLNHMYDRLGISRGEAQEHIGNMQRNLDLKPYNNFTDANGNKTTMSLNGIREDAKTHGISEQTLNEYLADYLNVDRYSQGKPVRGVAYTDTMSKENIKKLESQHPEIKRIAQNVWTFEQNQLQNMVDSGLISESFANELKKKNPHYVRIQRDVKGLSNNQKIKDNFNGVEVNRQIDTAKGGNQNILPIMESIAKYTEQVQQSERINLFGQELAKTLSMGSEDTSINSITDEESFGINPELIKENSDGTYTMTIFKNGVATVVPINKGIYESLTPNKSVQAIEGSNLFKKLTYTPKKISEMFRNLTTQKNPIFMFTNAFRDIGDAPFNSKYTGEFIKSYASTEALRQVAGDGVYNQLYEAAGGKQNSYFNNGEFVDKTQSKASKLKDKLLMPIEKGNDLVESVPRMAEFIATIKANGYEVNADGELVVKNQNKAKKSANKVLNEALYNAAEVTTNFKRGGDVAKMLNRNGATFFNASIQGFDKQVRNFFALASGDKKQIVNLLLKALVFGIAPTMLNDAMNDDDDEYKEMQEYQKDNYYLFKLKDGQWIRIPKGRAVSVIGSAVRRGRNYLEGDKKAFQGFGEFAADQVAPNSFLNNNIFSPLSQVKNNKSWSGNKIISDSMAKRPTEEQYNEKTDEASKFIGKAIKDLPLPESMKNFKSPLAIHYLIDQYSGAIGDVFLPMITEKSSSKYNPLVAPFISKFTADSVYSNRSVSDYYDKKTEIETQKNSTKATPIDVAKSSYMNSRNYDISDLYKQQKQIQSDSSLSKSEKYDKAREKQKEINKTAKEIVNDVDNIQEEEYYVKIGDYYYKKVIKNGEVKYERDTSKNIPTEKYALYDYFKEKYEKSKESD